MFAHRSGLVQRTRSSRTAFGASARRDGLRRRSDRGQGRAMFAASSERLRPPEGFRRDDHLRWPAWEPAWARVRAFFGEGACRSPRSFLQSSGAFRSEVRMKPIGATFLSTICCSNSIGEHLSIWTPKLKGKGIANFLEQTFIVELLPERLSIRRNGGNDRLQESSNSDHPKSRCNFMNIVVTPCFIFAPGSG
jgi:hypothetical protein